MDKNDPVFIPAPFFFIRTARLPIEFFYNLLKEKDISSFLISFFQSNEFVREAIAISSPNLYEALHSKKIKQESISSLLKYVLRMSTRATPFGLFSFVSLGSWQQFSQVQFDSKKIKKRARPDMEWLIKTIDQIVFDSDLFHSQKLKKNPFLYESMDRIILPYPRRHENKHEEISIRATPLVRMILDLSVEEKSASQMIDEILATMPTLESSKIVETLRILLNREFILSSLYPTLLTENPFLDLLSSIKFPPPHITNISSLFNRYNETPIGSGEFMLIEIKNEMEKLISTSNPIQVDSFYSNEQFLSKAVQNQLQLTAELLWKLSFSRKKFSPLQSYHGKFLDKYGHRLVPLLDLFDPEIGLGVPECYTTSTQEQENLERNLKWTKWLNESWYQCISKCESEINVTDEILKSIETESDSKEIPRSFDLFCEIIANSSSALDSGDFLIAVPPFGFGDGCSSLGRFIDMFNEKQKKLVSDFLKSEEQLEPNSIFVETSYFPNKNLRAANVAIHSNFRGLEVNLGYSKNGDRSISLDKIYIGATEDRFYFSFEEGGRELIFGATNFLNPEFAPFPIRFLRDASKFSFRAICPFSWGDLEEMCFHPRIRYKNIILSPATWRITLSLINAKQIDPVETIAKKFIEWSEKETAMPHLVFLTLGDHRILLDRTLPTHAEEIARELKKLDTVFLVEKIGIKEWSTSDQGTHCCEFVVPFIKNLKHSFNAIQIAPFKAVSNHVRLKLPNSEWTYARLYLSTRNECAFLTKHLAPFFSQCVDQGEIQSWFYVRYHDALGSHIRVRWKGEKDPKLSKFFTWIRIFLVKGYIREFCLAPYEREVERYGGETAIESAEDFFCVDSNLTTQILYNIVSKNKSLPDYIIASISIVDLLKGFGLGIPEQIKFLKKLNIQMKLLDGFRKWKPIIQSATRAIFLESTLSGEHGELSSLFLCFEKRKKYQSIYNEKLKNLSENGILMNSIDNIYHSILHMHCNRLLGINRELEKKALIYASHSVSILGLSNNTSFLS